jgi:hypothetical protein
VCDGLRVTEMRVAAAVGAAAGAVVGGVGVGAVADVDVGVAAGVGVAAAAAAAAAAVAVADVAVVVAAAVGLAAIAAFAVADVAVVVAAVVGVDGVDDGVDVGVGAVGFSFNCRWSSTFFCIYNDAKSANSGTGTCSARAFSSSSFLRERKDSLYDASPKKPERESSSSSCSSPNSSMRRNRALKIPVSSIDVPADDTAF